MLVHMSGSNVIQTPEKFPLLTEDQVCDLRREFNLSRTHGKLMARLIERHYINDKTMVESGEAIGGSSLKVGISRLRKRMNPHGVKILSMRNMGYWLTDTKQDILARLPTRVTTQQ